MSTVYAEELPSDPLQTPGPVYGPFLPLLIIALAVAGWYGFQTFELWQEHDALVATLAGQDKPIAESQKMRDSLDAFARQIAALADGGNANARLAVDELKRRGITIDQTPPPTAPSK